MPEVPFANSHAALTVSVALLVLFLFAFAAIIPKRLAEFLFLGEAYGMKWPKKILFFLSWAVLLVALYIPAYMISFAFFDLLDAGVEIGLGTILEFLHIG